MNEIDRMAAALCRTSPNHSTFHFPGDEPRKWKSPGGAVYDTNCLSPSSAETLREMARAAKAAQ